jgi:ketosteroid isomerase-like protein
MKGEVEDVVSAYEHYFRAFQTLDARAVLPYCYTPCVFLSSRGVVAANSESETESVFSEMMSALRTRGFAKSVWTDLSAKRLSEVTALLSTRVARLAADGRELERFGATYLLHKTDAQWKIAVLTLHDADTVVTLGR